MFVDCVLASPRITQVDPDDEPLSEVVLSHPPTWLGFLDESHKVTGFRSLIEEAANSLWRAPRRFWAQ
jgi:hypothetical protein